MAAPPSTRFPEPIPPATAWKHWRYERRHGFLPEDGREDLPRTGRTTLYRVEWGRAGLDACVMLTRWEHRHVGGWKREEVVDHAWVSLDDSDGIGAARLRLRSLGERLEEEADDARLAGRLQDLPAPAQRRDRWLSRGRRRPWHRGFRVTPPGGPAPEAMNTAAAVYAAVLVLAVIVTWNAPRIVLAPIAALAVIGWGVDRAERRGRTRREAARAARVGLTVDEYRAAERRIARLSRDLEAGEDFVEDLARDPR
jgi:hypothetical protein